MNTSSLKLPDPFRNTPHVRCGGGSEVGNGIRSSVQEPSLNRVQSDSVTISQLFIEISWLVLVQFPHDKNHNTKQEMTPWQSQQLSTRLNGLELTSKPIRRALQNRVESELIQQIMSPQYFQHALQFPALSTGNTAKKIR